MYFRQAVLAITVVMNLGWMVNTYLSNPQVETSFLDLARLRGKCLESS
jgi:hypothetical protein